jgi:23S rRNA (pseudouridine1915-N3)-methyltransferase
MNIWLLNIATRGRGSFEAQISDYVQRTTRFLPCARRTFAAESKLLAFVEGLDARTRPTLLLLDSGGTLISSEEMAQAMATYRDAGLQQLIVAVGPANGWSSMALHRADRLISFGRITLPHELAMLIAAEQVYRAFTILAGHPYHSGH